MEDLERPAGWPATATCRAKADLLRRLGRPGDAATAYRSALDLADNARRAFLAGRIAEVCGRPG